MRRTFILILFIPPLQNSPDDEIISLSSCFISRRRKIMTDHIYKKIELVGSSQTSVEDAVQNAISKANQTIENLRWFEVLETRGQIEAGKIAYWQVTIKVGFQVEG
jgi:flavin-binding protein dodecin